jgi:ubiquinone/menaquinone biosynthesis C-methylase UbiE
MYEHIKAWNDEYECSIWKGHYSLDIIGSCSQGRLLDAGCGSGKYAIPLTMRGFDVVAFDISKIGLKMAQTRCASRNLDVDLLAANIYQIPFKDNSFDIAWCYGVLQHLFLKEREYTVGEFRRVLKKGGILFIEVFGDSDMRYGGNKVEHNTFSRENGIVYHYFNKNEIAALLNGFSYRIFESRKEKRFDGVYYIRHMISATAKKI